jgi:rod shape-determining protein MreC
VTRFRRYRDIVLVVLLLAVPFFFLRASIRKPEDLNAIDRALLRVSAPLEYLASALARGASSLLSDYVYLVDVKADNNKLAYENARLKSEVRRLAASEAESRRLRRMLSLRETTKTEAVSAVVIGKDITEYFRVAHLVLDNSAPGIRPNMPVLSLSGAVGTIQRVAGDKVDVQLTVDSGFGVDVVVERTGARGFVRGVGDPSRYVVRVEYVQRTDEIEQGDVLVTSGYGCRFPKGVPVAKVTNVVKRVFGIYQQVEAEPTVDFSRLEEVQILMTDAKDCAPVAERKPRR